MQRPHQLLSHTSSQMKGEGLQSVYCRAEVVPALQEGLY